MIFYDSPFASKLKISTGIKIILFCNVSFSYRRKFLILKWDFFVQNDVAILVRWYSFELSHLFPTKKLRAIQYIFSLVRFLLCKLFNVNQTFKLSNHQVDKVSLLNLHVTYMFLFYSIEPYILRIAIIFWCSIIPFSVFNLLLFLPPFLTFPAAWKSLRRFRHFCFCRVFDFFTSFKVAQKSTKQKQFQIFSIFRKEKNKQ